ncbi:MAG: hypothetical protein II731_01285 [Succinivibrio sp.]|nr:hypothetical protein [Succinivibrio sp.]
MILIVISTSPLKSGIYIQGIESALNIAESESESVTVFLDSEFSLSVNEETKGDEHVKRLKQLFLFDIDVYSDRPLCLDNISCLSRKELQKNADKEVVF